MTLVEILREFPAYSKLVWWAAVSARKYSGEEYPEGKGYSWVYSTWKSGAADIKDFLWWRDV